MLKKLFLNTLSIWQYNIRIVLHRTMVRLHVINEASYESTLTITDAASEGKLISKARWCYQV